MRVCHVVYSYVPFDPRVQKEVSSLRLRGHEVDIVCLRDLGQPSVEDLEHVRIHRVPLRAIRGGMFRYAYQYATFFLLASLLLLRLQLQRRFNVVHVHSLPDFQIFCALPSKAFGASLILDMHEAMPEILAARFELSMNHPLAKVACALEALSGLIADRVLTVNSTIARLLEARGIDGRKLLVVMNSTDRPPSVSASPDDLLDRMALAGRTVIVYAGGVDPERDLETVVRAAAILSKSRPVSLLIFGKGPESYREELRGMVRNAPPMLDARIGDLSLYVIKRGERFAIRVKDPNSPVRKEFKGIDAFPPNPAYRIVAEFVPYDPPREVAVPTILGTTEKMKAPGYVKFKLAGRELTLE